MSIAMIRSAPLYFAPWITLRPTPPQPIDRDRVALADVGGVRRGAEAGEHAAADERGARERDVVVDLHREISGHTSSSENVPRPDIWCSGAPSRAKRGVMSSWPPVAIGHEAGLAHLRRVVRAEVARAALRDEREHDVVAGLHGGRRPRRPPRRRPRPRGRAPTAAATAACRSRPTGRSGRRPRRPCAPGPRRPWARRGRRRSTSSGWSTPSQTAAFGIAGSLSVHGAAAGL